MKSASFFVSIGFVSIGILSISLLFAQQPPPVPAVPRAPVIPLSAADLEAIPLVAPHAGKSVTKALFDGKTLKGWRGNMDWWSVRDNMIVGKFNDKVPTSFLFTDENFSDFRLMLESKMVESDNHAGVCFWGEIAQQGVNPWYVHGPLVIFPNPSMWDYNAAKGLSVYKATMDKVTSQHDWVKVEILAQGNQVRTAFNGVEVMRWREADLSRIKEGPVGVQLHAWTGPQEVLYRNIVIETFPKDSFLKTVNGKRE